jgi:hypothetical protein
VTQDLSDLSVFTERGIPDLLTQRILDCLADDNSTAADAAVLVRHWIRRSDLTPGNLTRAYELDPKLSDRIRSVHTLFGLEEHDLKSGGTGFAASPWEPNWVVGCSSAHPVDFC